MAGTESQSALIVEIPEAEATEPEVKSDEIDSTLNELLLEQNEHEIGKALSADAMEAAALHRMLIVELSQFDEE